MFLDEDRDIPTYPMNVAIFGSTSSSPTSAQYVKNVNAVEFAKYFPETEKIIRKQTNVDNVAVCHDTLEGAIKLNSDVRKVFRSGGMKCSDFVSDYKEVMAGIGEVACDSTKMNMNLGETVSERIGMIWDVNVDAEVFS